MYVCVYVCTEVPLLTYSKLPLAVKIINISLVFMLFRMITCNVWQIYIYIYMCVYICTYIYIWVYTLLTHRHIYATFVISIVCACRKVSFTLLLAICIYIHTYIHAYQYVGMSSLSSCILQLLALWQLLWWLIYYMQHHYPNTISGVSHHSCCCWQC